LDGSSSLTSGRFPAANARLLADVRSPATRYGETKNTACPTQQRLRYSFLVVGDRTAGDEIIYPEIDLELRARPDGRVMVTAHQLADVAPIERFAHLCGRTTASASNCSNTDHEPGNAMGHVRKSSRLREGGC
jgi:hypothetical protein